MQLFCTAAMLRTRDAWLRKLVRPRERDLFVTEASGMKSLFVSFTFLRWKRYQRARKAVTICPITVATAAPVIPHLKP